ncbi:MAG: shikimate dehydrogenase [Kiritimatiellae bacterium]|nr:shikimate dehydrogenase [Kiritimatiellia bacterium]
MKKFAVIGHPIAHSLSPTMHAANFKALGFDATYEKFDVAPEELEAFVRAKQREGYAGLNVTVPHKIAVIPLLDHPDESVKRYGACNTLKFEADGTISGYNTDVIGFVTGLAAHGFGLKGKKVVILGCGGAGSALAACACYEGAAELKVADLRGAAVAALVDKLNALNLGTRVSGLDVLDGTASDAQKAVWGAAATAADLVVNATPMGLHPGEPSALPPACFHPGQFVLDIVPTKDFPPTAAAAVQAGATATDGLEFLVGQGAKSFEIWTGVAADRAAMLEAIRR